jgi:hypothetical protein
VLSKRLERDARVFSRVKLSKNAAFSGPQFVVLRTCHVT